MSQPHAPAPDPQIGDVIEITTSHGFAYAQFTHEIPLHGQLLRILPRLYVTRPADLASLVQQRERYVTFYALRMAFHYVNIEVAIVGRFEIPERNRPVPLFRSPPLEPREPGEPPYWTLWDAQRQWRVDRLTEAQRSLPVDGEPPTEVFLDQIVSGWSPRDYDGIPVDRTPPAAAGRSRRRPRQRSKRPRPRIGDVIEFATPEGFAYAQFTHDHPRRGELLRVLPGLYASRPANLTALVRQRERYVTFSMLRAILRDNEVTIVGGREVPEAAIVGPFPIPERNRPIPLFRSPMLPDPITGEIPFWTLWDEERTWRVEKLTGEQRDLPTGGMPSHPLFIEQIVSGWQPRDDPLPRHVLYFPTELVAQVAAHRLRQHVQEGINIKVRRAPSGKLPPEREWLATAYGGEPPPPAWIAKLEAELAAKSERELRAELAAAERTAPVAEPEPEPPADPPMRHFLHFPTEAAAKRAATQLRAAGYVDVVVEAPESEYFADETPPGTRPLDRDWDVRASGDVPPPGEPFGDTREHLEALAEELGGEYGGWELAVRD